MIDLMSSERGIDPQLWHACAGTMVDLPPLNSTVFYFPQGHLHHSHLPSNLPNFPPLPPLLPCLLSRITYLSHPYSDHLFARLTLSPTNSLPLHSNPSPPSPPQPPSFAKTLTQSDANNGGGFSVPRFCADTIFPRLDYSAHPPAQTILATDLHGVVWRFRHIYRGTPRRHLLTTGWSNFVNAKRLVAGDSIVFLRADSGDLCVGIRRSKKGIGGDGDEDSPAASLGADSVLEAARLAASGRVFEVVYYPRASSPAFCVSAAAVRAAMQVRWCSGMRFKMAFETEDSSRISWFMGTVSGALVDDPLHWPDSPWRLLQVVWDEPELLQNVKRVNPWLVELVATMPHIQVSPRKRLRLPVQHFSGRFDAGIQGARHDYFRQPAFAALPRQHPGLFPPFVKPPHCVFPGHGFPARKAAEDVSCFLTIGRYYDASEKSEKSLVSAPKFMLFGKAILTEEQMSSSGESSSSSGELFIDKKIGDIFGSQRSEILNNVNHNPFCEFLKTARTLTLVADSGSENLAR